MALFIPQNPLIEALVHPAALVNTPLVNGFGQLAREMNLKVQVKYYS